MIIARHSFIDCLLQAINETEQGIEDFETINKKIREEFLKQNSETPDNVTSIQRIEYGKIPIYYERPTYGLKLQGKDLLISHIIWKAIETDGGVSLILQTFPELSREEAEAVLRLCTVILSNIEATDSQSNC